MDEHELWICTSVLPRDSSLTKSRLCFKAPDVLRRQLEEHFAMIMTVSAVLLNVGPEWKCINGCVDGARSSVAVSSQAVKEAAQQLSTLQAEKTLACSQLQHLSPLSSSQQGSFEPPQGFKAAWKKRKARIPAHAPAAMVPAPAAMVPAPEAMVPAPVPAPAAMVPAPAAMVQALVPAPAAMVPAPEAMVQALVPAPAAMIPPLSQNYTLCQYDFKDIDELGTNSSFFSPHSPVELQLSEDQTKHLTDLRKELSETWRAVVAVEEKLADVFTRMTSAEARLDMLEDTEDQRRNSPPTLASEVEMLNAKLGEYEDRDRQVNLRIYGFPEHSEEKDALSFPKTTLPDILQADFPGGLDLERAFTGLAPIKPGAPPRPFVKLDDQVVCRRRQHPPPYLPPVGPAVMQEQWIDENHAQAQHPRDLLGPLASGSSHPSAPPPTPLPCPPAPLRPTNHLHTPTLMLPRRDQPA
ncbi:hypothetical protein F7725_028155 [Dissostichus mawsoni]|uniref:Uncharacterized protein n=1 Tax=Dissostichus mawsoni TaxID=36200 RepID=A0A7J5XG54_DISMA|nr:hypothetical protein F7725_028155 [Dissostichus mawsoni]